MTEWMIAKSLKAIVSNYISPDATYGKRTMVWHFAIVLDGARIGDDCSIGARSEVGRGCMIGDKTRIGSGVFLPPNSVVGKSVFIGPNTTFTDDRHPKVPAEGDAPYEAMPPIIEDFASIGAGCVILPGVRIGRGARVAAGSVVTKDVPAGQMIMGWAARRHVMPMEWEHDQERTA